MSQVLGVLIPGGIVRTDFVPSDQSGTKFTLALTGKSHSYFTCVDCLCKSHIAASMDAETSGRRLKFNL